MNDKTLGHEDSRVRKPNVGELVFSDDREREGLRRSLDL